MRHFYETRTAFVHDVLAQVAAPGGRAILDAGFIGSYAEATVHYAIVDMLRDGDRLTGIDIDAARLEAFLAHPKTQQRQERFDLRYERRSVFDTGYESGAFDAVLLLEVFEHLHAPYRVFDEVARLLKPGGSFILTYPNPLSLTKLLRYLWQGDLLDDGYLRAYRGAPDHKVFPHPPSLANYLVDVGLQPRSVVFIKYAYRQLGALNRLLPRWNVTRKLAAYVGVHATRRGPERAGDDA